MERIVSNHPLQHIKIIDTAVIELCYFYLKLNECIILLPYVGEIKITRMWANAQPDGRPAEHRWRPLFNAAKFG